MPQPVALITGAAQTIGRSIVEKLRQHHWRVAALDCDEDAIADAQNTWAAGDNEILWLTADVASETDVANCIQRIVSQWERLDAVVNNAAITNPVSERPEDLQFDFWQRVIAVNLSGSFLVCKYAIPFLKKYNGAIINIASTRALQSEPNCEAYAASKGGLLSLTHALAASLAGNVRVNAISPGWIDTGPWKSTTKRQSLLSNPADHAWHWTGRIGLPEDVASMVHYLFSPAAGFITGQNFIIDGGVTRKMVYPPET
ncbi:SDR family oxidoreductase [Chrysiogenes arsenatis]|uniref:SDR family oxidoreductase n=1 Tax=Chrysiogenes arsenatis TaxID=309797 RepID=UPI000412AE55|nr:SDR family oxidoreductase [Chrysiogenes arsenatis]